MTKAELRRQFLTERKSLSAEQVDARSLKICQIFFSQKYMDGKTTIHVFLPIQRHNEVNTWHIIHRLWADFPTVEVVVSVTDTEAHALTHYELKATTILVENRWGIPEPITHESAAISVDQIDIVLVPLLVFDHQGHRVGYGGGFYDRFLADCRPDCLTVGLSLFEPIDQIDDVEPTDIPLECCITPNQIWLFLE